MRRIDRLVSVAHAGDTCQVVRLPADMEVLWNGVDLDRRPPTMDERSAPGATARPLTPA